MPTFSKGAKDFLRLRFAAMPRGNVIRGEVPPTDSLGACCPGVSSLDLGRSFVGGPSLGSHESEVADDNMDG